MTNLAVEVFADVKTLLKNTNADDDRLIELFVETAIQGIVNYCNVRELPRELMHTAAQMAATLFKNERVAAAVAEQGGTAAAGQISSITEDGRTVTFATDRTAAASVTITAESLLRRYEKEMNRYRRPYRT